MLVKLSPSLQIAWRKVEFWEWARRDFTARRKRRVGLTYYQPIGFGFSIVLPIRQGFWQDSAGRVLVGYFPSNTNFHYLQPGLYAGTWIRSDANWPEPVLEPLQFEEGFRLMMDQLAQLGQVYNQPEADGDFFNTHIAGRKMRVYGLIESTHQKTILDVLDRCPDDAADVIMGLCRNIAILESRHALLESKRK